MCNHKDHSNLKKQFLSLIFLLVSVVVSCDLLFAAERTELADVDKDGRKETQFIYDGDKIVRELVDKNGDGKPDVTTYYQNGKKHHGEGASNFDGRINTWYIYSVQGALRQIAKDSNYDKKPDQFFTLLKGRNLMLREYDKNFDGKIDKRQLVEWSPTRLKIPGQPAIPGYVPLWTEEDKDFDGKIDSYTEKGNKNPSKEKIGKFIDGQPSSALQEEKQGQPSKENAGAAAGPGEGKINAEERKIKQLNEQHGLKT